MPRRSPFSRKGGVQTYASSGDKNTFLLLEGKKLTLRSMKRPAHPRDSIEEYDRSLLYIVLILFSMNFINKAVVLLLLVLQCCLLSSSTLQLSKNSFISSGRQSISLTAFAPSGFQDNFFTTPLTHTVANIANVYYSTAEVSAQTWSPYYPGTSNNFIWYQIDVANFSNTHLTTNIRGFFYPPFFSQFTFSYLLVLANNPFIGSYVVFQEIEFTPNTTARLTSFPLKYQSGDLLDYAYLIKQIKKIYPYTNMVNIGFDYWIELDILRSNVDRTFTATVDLPNYIRNFGNYSVKYLVVVIAKQALDKDYPKYIFRALMLSTASYSYIRFSNLPDPASADSNLIFGITRYYFYNIGEPSFQFSLSFTNNSARFDFSGDLTYGTAGSLLRFAYAKFTYQDCNSTYFVYNETLKQCFDGCIKDNEYFNTTSASCAPCSQFCRTCYDSQNCSSCYNGTYRELINFQCVPIIGYYESNVNLSSQCSSSCVQCHSTATNCTECNALVEILLSNACYPCTNLTEGCKTCTQSLCFSCISGYRFINQSLCNLPCADPNCLICSNANTSICYQCSNSGLLLINQVCCKPAVCGDGMINSTSEECDDGNTIAHDGCSSSCNVEPNYQCTSKTSALGFNYTLYCAYLHPIDFRVVSVEKLNYANKLKIIISVAQFEEYFWNTRSSLSSCFVQAYIPFRDMRVEFINRSQQKASGPSSKLASPLTNSYSQSSLLAVYFEYLRSIHHQNIVLSFNFSSSVDHSLTQIPTSSVSLIIDPDNNHYALLYSQKLYSQQKMLSNLYFILSIACMALFVISFFLGCKRIPAEMLMVFQVAYASLLTAPKVSPLLSALTSLFPANNGYNAMYISSLRPFQDTLIDDRARGAVLYSQFLYNFNLGLLFVLIPLIAGVAAMLFRKIKKLDEEQDKKVARIVELAFGQLVYVSLIFAGCIVGVSSVLEFQFGIKEIGSAVGMASLLITIVILLFYVFYGFLRVKRSFAFEQYRSVIVKNTSNFSLVFQIIFFYMGIATGILLTMLKTYKYVNIVVVILPLSLLFVTWAKPIFAKPNDKFRTQLNLLTIVFLQIPFLYHNISSKQASSEDEDTSLLMPMSVGILLVVNFLGNLSFLAYEIAKLIRNQSRKKDLTSLQQEYVSTKTKQFKEIYKSNYNPLGLSISMPMFAKGFIEFSQKDVNQDVEMEDLRLLKKQRRELQENPKLPASRSIFNNEFMKSSRKLSNGVDQL